jgi:hypothetical protein
MELEDLKSIWQKSDLGFYPLNEEEISRMIKGSSNSIVAKLKRNIWFELVITLLIGVGLLVYAFTIPMGALKFTTISILIALLAYIFYYVKKLYVIKRFENTNENLLINLQALHDRLEQYLKFYKRSYTILYPFYFVLGFLFIAIERGMDNVLHLLQQPSVITKIIGIAILFYFITTTFTTWYLKKLYGNHIDKLNKLISDIMS